MQCPSEVVSKLSLARWILGFLSSSTLGIGSFCNIHCQYPLNDLGSILTSLNSWQQSGKMPIRVKSRRLSQIEGPLRAPSPANSRFPLDLPGIGYADTFREVVKKVSV